MSSTNHITTSQNRDETIWPDKPFNPKSASCLCRQIKRVSKGQGVAIKEPVLSRTKKPVSTVTPRYVHLPVQNSQKEKIKNSCVMKSVSIRNKRKQERLTQSKNNRLVSH